TNTPPDTRRGPCRDELTGRRIWPAVPSGASFSTAPANTGRVGVAKFARLSRLNTSNRIWRRVLPTRAWFFTSDRSTLANPAARRKLRGVFPRVPRGCRAKALTSNQWFGSPVMRLDGSVPGFTLGRSSPLVEMLPLLHHFTV